MGNCIGSRTRKRLHEEDDHDMEEQYQDYVQEQKWESEFGKETSNDFEKGGLKIKIILTKEELQWLMLQLNGGEGKKLEGVLQEIERERERGKVSRAWKPSLESIKESPEGLEMERS
ncbi:uncharacterized protein LOC8287774 [Ricinus communis]|uniref:uncharacterized protein LOC8287774 n=1 Tax=Ricinus communis TaxID=3988 RepID=UPI00201A68C5|nr:uncharacterized protein LOC8287774 [Ricinus communis]